MSMYSYCMFMYLHRANWHSSATLTEVFPCLFLSCKANARVKPAKTGARPSLFQIVVFFYVLFVLCCSVYCLCVCVCVCKCVLYCCHRLATQLQLTNIKSWDTKRAVLTVGFSLLSSLPTGKCWYIISNSATINSYCTVSHLLFNNNPIFQLFFCNRNIHCFNKYTINEIN